MPSIAPSWRKRRGVSRSPDGRSSSSLGEARVQRADALEIVGVARVEAPVALAHALVRRAVDVVGRTRDRRQAAGEVRLAQSLGREREIRAGAEAAEALPEDAPALDAELLPDPLRVAHDRVGAVQLEVLRLLLRGSVPGSVPTGVERPVPRWSSSSTR